MASLYFFLLRILCSFHPTLPFLPLDLSLPCHRAFSQPCQPGIKARALGPLGESARATSADGASAPPTPRWPPTFQADFSEDNYFLFVTLSTRGTYFYDHARLRERVDRDSGLGDRYCGSAMPGYDTPCTQLVVNGERFLIFPKEEYCCKCCTEESGCGVLRPDWLANATYLGHDYIFGVMTSKWYMAGLQNNYYWHAYDNVPVRIYQEPVTQMTFEHSSYATPSTLNDSLFTIPESLDCSLSCYGVCALLSTSSA